MTTYQTILKQIPIAFFGAAGKTKDDPEQKHLTQMESEMKQSLILLFLLTSVFGALAKADEYTLRIETIGYRDQVLPDKPLEETVLSCVEIVVRPGTKFRTKTTVGKELLSLNGIVTPMEDGKFLVKLNYAHSTDNGRRGLLATGGEQVVFDTTAVETILSVSLDEPVLAGGFSTRTTDPDSDPIASKSHHFLKLEKFNSDAN